MAGPGGPRRPEVKKASQEPHYFNHGEHKPEQFEHQSLDCRENVADLVYSLSKFLTRQGSLGGPGHLNHCTATEDLSTILRPVSDATELISEEAVTGRTHSARL